MTDRETAEDALCEKGETEIAHRFAHALLKPKGLYQMWTDLEIEHLEPIIDIDFNKGKTARFILASDPNFTPALHYYVLKEIFDNKKKKL